MPNDTSPYLSFMRLRPNFGKPILIPFTLYIVFTPPARTAFYSCGHNVDFAGSDAMRYL